MMKPPSAAGYVGSTGRLNISMAQEELLLWHSILGHYNMYNNQKLMTATGISRYSLPLYTSCLRGKGRATFVKSTTELLNPEQFDVIKYGDLLPGDTVSIDQYECRVKGRLPNSRGREDPAKMFCGGDLFNDHASSKIDVLHQVSLNISDTIRCKTIYEQQAEEVGVVIKACRGDNGVYTSNEFRKDLVKRGQTMTYSGVGAHAQNVVTERGIPTVVNSVRTMMIHQALLWSEKIDTRLCPFALSHAVYL